ncbi:hypothetical protein [Gordonia sp. (in: high G+C Gram-positive bacteria)]|uniref:hypothetical protein n=1 Tax=Gordonia sp. (in: high G+C Gram-positive bacteria) TaxID=84139 RepID=UPI003526EBA7
MNNMMLFAYDATKIQQKSPLIQEFKITATITDTTIFQDLGSHGQAAFPIAVREFPECQRRSPILIETEV